MVWEPLEIPVGTSGTTSGDSAAELLALVLGAVARRQRQHRQITVDTLSEVLAREPLPPTVREIAEYFRAECERDLGHLESSLSGMHSVAGSGGRMADDASRGLLHLARRLGRFPDVLTAAERLGTRGRRYRSLGDLWWTQGKFSLSCATYARGRDDAAAAAEHGEAALSQACLAFAASFGDRSRAREQIDRSTEMLRGVTGRWADLQRRNAELLCDAGADPAIPDRAAVIEEDALASGLTSPAAYARFAVCFHAAVLEDAAGLAEANTRLQQHVRGAEFAYLLQLSYFMADGAPPPDLPRAQWIDGEQETRARWMRCAAERRQELDTLL